MGEVASPTYMIGACGWMGQGEGAMHHAEALHRGTEPPLGRVEAVVGGVQGARVQRGGQKQALHTDGSRLQCGGRERAANHDSSKPQHGR